MNNSVEITNEYESCHAQNIPESDTVFARSYYWHRPCAAVYKYLDGEEYVDFPSGGKLIPSTIIERVK